MNRANLRSACCRLPRPLMTGEVLDAAFRLFRAGLLRCLPYSGLAVLVLELPTLYATFFAPAARGRPAIPELHARQLRRSSSAARRRLARRDHAAPARDVARPAATLPHRDRAPRCGAGPWGCSRPRRLRVIRCCWSAAATLLISPLPDCGAGVRRPCPCSGRWHCLSWRCRPSGAMASGPFAAIAQCVARSRAAAPGAWSARCSPRSAWWRCSSAGRGHRVA